MFEYVVVLRLPIRSKLGLMTNMLNTTLEMKKINWVTIYDCSLEYNYFKMKYFENVALCGYIIKVKIILSWNTQSFYFCKDSNRSPTKMVMR